ncbi:MAG: Cif family virulence factor [Planctomycetota bacterium]|jgi:hypothetical protein
MKKLVIMNSVVAVLMMVLAGSCQVGGPSDKELINWTMTDWRAALKAQDLDRLMATYSENYVSARASGKDSVRERMKGIFDRGWMNNVKVNLENAKTTIDRDKAEFGPIEFISDEDKFSYEYILQKEYGAWFIVGSKRQE